MYVQVELHLSIEHRRYGWSTWYYLRGCPSGLFWQPPWSWLSSSCDLCLSLVFHQSAPPHDVPTFDASPMHVVPQPPNVSIIMHSQPRHRHNVHGGTVGRSWRSINWGGVERRDNVWRRPSGGASGEQAQWRRMSRMARIRECTARAHTGTLIGNRHVLHQSCLCSTKMQCNIS